ncbi:Alpha/beta hydrolase family protein [Pseudovibrio axinellae]|uniref:Alpha/beta hydrolase family protein n=1 Tax=Pseudovibrio axinellae TaxID=989403 RepID=A0A165XNX2_9HYPH|nr:alpha/beta hydrolase [Pseudovibrio axinellae]KZL17900.1 Alpha/beta hydrolase family protein [Pseudovibrio axinellae]SER58466.1 Pimeloyl-ACP methyl ester carboxylesterase [Pseudovibrio axinellae]
MKNKRVFLLHGAPGHGDIWKPIVDMLPADLEVVCPTLEWFGPKTWQRPGELFSSEAHCEQLAELLNEKSHKDNYVAAWSYSTHPTLLCLLNHPELVKAAFLYEPGLSTYLESAEELDAFQHSAARAFPPIIEALHEHGNAAAVKALFDSSGGEGCFEAMSAKRQALYQQSAQMMPLLLGGGQPPANIKSSDLKKITTPVTVGLGSKSEGHFDVASKRVAASIPSACLQLQDGCDHMMPEKAPSHFADMLKNWLNTANLR